MTTYFGVISYSLPCDQIVGSDIRDQRTLLLRVSFVFSLDGRKIAGSQGYQDVRRNTTVKFKSSEKYLMRKNNRNSKILGQEKKV